MNHLCLCTLYVTLACSGTIYGQDHSLARIAVDTLLHDKSAINILDLEQHLGGFPDQLAVRILDRNDLIDTATAIIYFQPDLQVITSKEPGLDFNTGWFREIIIWSIEKLSGGTYTVDFYLYEYGCRERLVDLYSVHYEFEKKYGNFILIQRTYGDADLH